MGRETRSLTWGVVVVLSAGCGDSELGGTEPEPAPPVASIQIEQSLLSFDWIGQRVRVEFVARDASGRRIQDPLLMFSSSDESVVLVDSAGVARGVGEGEAEVTATADGATGTVTARVQVAPLAGAEEVLAFTDVTVHPMDTRRRLEHHTVLIRGGWVESVGPSADVEVPEEALVVDGRGRYLIPGLMDAHTHTAFEEDLLPYVANGVTTILNMGTGRERTHLEWRAEVEAGQRVAPTIWVGGFVDGPGGRASASRTISTAEDGRRVASEIAAGGLHFVKAYNSIPGPAFDALMEEARSLDLSVAAHGVRAPGMDGILAAGVRMIAHAEEYIYTHFGNTTDQALVPSAVQITSEAGAYVTANLSAFQEIAEQWGRPGQVDVILARPGARFLHPDWRRRWRDENPYVGRPGGIGSRVVFLKQLTGAFSEGGVPLLLGTDSPAIPGLLPGFSIHTDLVRLTESGLTNFDALRAGTGTSGAFLSSFFPGSQPVGTVTVGARADLVLLDADPLADLDALRDPVGVVLRGRWLPREELETLMEALAGGF